jgi:hypothetical protein
VTDATHDRDTHANGDQEERERSRPDRPTDSDRAHLAERDEGAHAEFIDAPRLEEQEPPPGSEDDAAAPDG